MLRLEVKRLRQELGGGLERLGWWWCMIVTLITTIGVDFSADIVGARFFDGFDTWVAIQFLTFD